MTIDQLRNEIEAAFKVHWFLNDKAHQQSHFEDVFQCGVHINKELGLGYPEKMILFAAYFHDLFAWSRINHHELSYEFVKNTDFKLFTDNLTPHEKIHVAAGCLEHRASFKGQFSVSFSELINSADRGAPKDVELLLARSDLYWREHFPHMDEKEREEGVRKHIKHKFGTKGYARIPSYYLQVFGKEYQTQQDAVDKL